jgi:hypothetical protein
MKTASASFWMFCVASAVWGGVAVAYHGEARMIAAGFYCMSVGFAWAFLELSKWRRM